MPKKNQHEQLGRLLLELRLTLRSSHHFVVFHQNSHEHVWMPHQRRNKPSSKMKQRTRGGRNNHPCEKSDPLRFPRQSYAQRSRENTDPQTHRIDHRNLRPHRPRQLQRTITTIPERTVQLSVKAPLNTSHPAERPFDPRLEVINETRAAHHAATTSDSGASHTSTIIQNKDVGTAPATAREVSTDQTTRVPPSCSCWLPNQIFLQFLL